MKILISGAGIAGLTLALCLGRRGRRPVVVEKAGQLRDAGYMIDFVDPGLRAAEQLGLLPELQRIHYPIDRLSFVDEWGQVQIAVPYRALRRKLFDDRHFNFLRGDLERVLYEQARDLVDVRFGTTVTSLAQAGSAVDVALSDGSRDSYDLVVGADGVHSHIRRLVFGDEARFFRYLGYETAAFLAEPNGLQIRREAFETLTAPGRQVAVYPVRDGRIATLFIHRALSPAPGSSVAVARTTLHEMYGQLDWIVPALLERADRVDDVYFDTVSQIEMPRWGRGRIVLVGDAAWCLSLLAGQGASMALVGATILDDALANARTDVEAAIARYEQRLRPTILARQAAGRRMAFWFVPSSRLQIVVRDLILRVSLWPGIDRLVKRAMGLSGKL